MFTFLIGLLILFVGYFFYGRFIERQFVPEPERKTPAMQKSASAYDDKQALPHWKCMLLHLLHIAGVGPVIGVVLGAKFGPVVFLIIPIANIFGGAVHDYLSGMISMRNGAGSFLSISNKFLGNSLAFLSTMLLLVSLFSLAASFTNVSSSILTANPIFENQNRNTVYVFWIVAIFFYYGLSTFFPIAQVVSKIANVFGFLLIFSTLLLLVFLSGHITAMPEFDVGNFAANFTQHPLGYPILPMLFVTVACGMISGFHGSQNSITAGIETNERNGRQTFFGMMVAEGVLAMIWAAVGVIGYAAIPADSLKFNGAGILSDFIRHIVSLQIGAEIVLLSVVVLAVTTADAALRIVRALVVDAFKFSQKSAEDRFLLCLPIFGFCVLVVFWSNITDGFAVLWNYFSLFNQSMAVVCLAISVCYLRSKGKNFIYAIIPLAFLSFIVFLYLLWISPTHIANAPYGFGMSYRVACVIAFLASAGVCFYCLQHGKFLSEKRKEGRFNPDGGKIATTPPPPTNPILNNIGRM